MACIRYIQTVTERPETLAAFYKTYFSMHELGRSADGDVALTDGFYNVSLVKPRNGEELGHHHYGIAIEDIREVEAKLEEFAPNADIQGEPGDLFHGEYRIADPNGITISLSEHGFHVPDGQRKLPEIRHVAFMVPNNEEVLRFYMNVFGFRESSRNEQIRARNASPTRWAADGSTAIAILPTPEWLAEHDVEPEGTNMKWGLNHFGFLVSDMPNFLKSLPEGSVSGRPDDRPAAEWRVSDPDGNPLDVSQVKGYEIDFGKWVRA
jgi:catechol 2,3-dioxygenase-like lactoylglutathione lyase family enzyme